MKKLAAMILVAMMITCTFAIANAETSSEYNITSTIGLDELSPINGGFNWNTESPADPFGNDYSDVCNSFIYHGNVCGNAYTVYSEYKLDGTYDILTMDISPFSHIGENASSFVQVYADNTLVYTSPSIQRKSGITHATINIHNAGYLKVVIRKGSNGCVMLTDVKLGKVDNELALYDSYDEYLHDQQTVSISTVQAINGGFLWDDAFPQDLYKNDYGTAANYTIYHGNVCGYAYTTFAEYRLDGLYSDFNCIIAPYSDFDAKANTYVQFYVDGVIRYTSPMITAKGGVNKVHIDLTGAEYFKIVVNKGENGCIMLADNVLTLNNTQKQAIPDEYTYLSELDAFNGGFEWNNQYPRDLMGNDYTFSNNYHVFHGNVCGYRYSEYAEYHLNGKYQQFSFDVSAYTDFGRDANSVVSVYADDDLIYTTTVTQKNGMIHSGDLNINGTAFLKIVIEKDENGCLILSDAKLK